MPERFGYWNTVARRFRRWAQVGVWEALFQAIQEPDYAWMLGGFDHGQGPQSRRGVKKSTATAESLGCSRGDFYTKLHAIIDALGHCLHLVLTPGHWADCTQLPGLLAALRCPPGAVVADKAYDTNAVLQPIGVCHAAPVIPPITSRNAPRAYDRNLYADRNKVEQFFGRLKEARGFATRYEKTAVSFLATAHLLAAID